MRSDRGATVQQTVQGVRRGGKLRGCAVLLNETLIKDLIFFEETMIFISVVH
jgi:hypothetical protein